MRNLSYKLFLILAVSSTFPACAFLHHTVQYQGKVENLENRAEFLRSDDWLLYRTPNGWMLTAIKQVLFDSKYEILDSSKDATFFVLLDGQQKHSDLFIFDLNKRSIQSVAAPDSTTFFTAAALSPDGKLIAARTKKIVDERDQGDDRFYLVDRETLQLKETPQPKKKVQIGNFAWNKDGTAIYNVASDFIGYEVIKRDLPAAIPEIVYGTLNAASPWRDHVKEGLRSSPLEARILCDNITVSTENEEQGISQDKWIQIKRPNSPPERIVKITSRERSCDGCQAFTALKPQFTSDCEDIYFSLGNQILVYDLTTKRVGKFAEGENVYLFPKGKL